MLFFSGIFVYYAYKSTRSGGITRKLLIALTILGYSFVIFLSLVCCTKLSKNSFQFWSFDWFR